VRRLALLLVLAALAAGCGGAGAPSDDPGAFASRVVGLIVHNKYSAVWDDLHPIDQDVAPFAEYSAARRATR